MKRILSVVLCIATVISLVPSYAFADGEPETADQQAIITDTLLEDSGLPQTTEPATESQPTVAPAIEPTVAPTIEPTVAPAIEPTVAPAIEPTVAPAIEPTVAPTIEPTVAPTIEPTVAPTIEPTVAPTIEPTVAPTIEPTQTPAPTEEPEEELYFLDAQQWENIFSRDDGQWLFPLSKDYYGNIVDWNGCRCGDPCIFCGEMHSVCSDQEHGESLYGAWGLDIFVPYGTEVYAPEDGLLWWTDWQWEDIGYTAVMEHPIDDNWSYYTVFQHLSAIGLNSGTQVKAGETIAYTGSSGDEDEPEHLAYSMFMAPRGMGESYAADPVTALAYIEQQGWLEEPLGTGMINNNPAVDSEMPPELLNTEFTAQLSKHPGTVCYVFDLDEPEEAAGKDSETSEETTTAGQQEAYPLTENEDPAATVDAAAAATIVASGNCGYNGSNVGSNVTWTLDDTGLLTISGTGAMYDFTEYSDPWQDYRSSFKEIVIEEGVTSIRERTFRSCKNVTSITIPSSMRIIDRTAWTGLDNLENVYISDIESWCRIQFGEENAAYDRIFELADNLYLNGQLVTDLVLPDTVTYIKDYAFAYYKKLTSVTLPSGITYIGEKAFYSCGNLNSINLPEGLTYIGEGAFRGCGLSSISLPDTITSLGEYAFYNCTSLSEVKLSENLTSISSNAFGNCTSLSSIELPDTITSLGEYAFYNCTSLSEVKLSEKLTTIGDRAFSSCTSLNSITLPENLSTIGDRAFSSCTSLNSITLPENLSTIGNYTFSECTSLASVTFPENLSAIGDYTFSECTSLASVTFPENLSAIGNYAFSGCTGMAELTIENDLFSLGEYAFSDCTGLIKIFLTGSLSSSGSHAFEGSANNKNVYINDLKAWCTTDFAAHDANPLYQGGSLYLNGELIDELVLPEDISKINTYTFSGCKDITSFSAAAGLTSIGAGVFYECRNLSSVSLPEGLTSIGARIFYDCDSLSSISLPEGLTTIGAYAFYDCDSLSSVSLPEGLTTIGVYAFYDCNSLSSISLPEGLTTIGSHAFYNCDRLSSVSLPEGLTSIGGSAFYECNSLSSISLPEGLTAIRNYTFCRCYSLVNISLPESLTSIGDHAFESCSVITSIDIPDGVTYIGRDAFFWCDKLKSVKLPRSLTSIEYEAFGNCRSLSNLEIPDGVTSIGRRAFAVCESLTSITLPDSVSTIYEAAFYHTALEDVYYKGSKARWRLTSIERDNEALENANIHYEVVYGDVTGIDPDELSVVVYTNKEKPERITESYVLSEGTYAETEYGIVSTDSSGQMTISTGLPSVEFFAPGYVARTISMERLRHTNVVFMQKESDYPVILSLWWENLDVLHERVELETMTGEDIILEPEVYWGKSPMKSIVLYQGDKKVELTGESSSVNLTEEFDIAEDIYIKATNAEGVSSTKPLFIEKEVEVDFEMKGDISFNLPEDAGPLEGMELNFKLGSKFPVKYVRDDEKFYVLIGFNVDSLDKTAEEKNAWVKETVNSIKTLKKNLETLQDELNKTRVINEALALYGVQLATSKGSFAKDGTDFTLMAYAEGYLDENDEIQLVSSGGVLTAEAKGSYTVQGMLWFMPVFLEVTFGGNIDAQLDLLMNQQTNTFAPDMELSAEIFVAAGPGIGVAKALSLSGGLEGEIPVEMEVNDTGIERFLARFQMKGYIKGKAGPFKKEFKMDIGDGRIIYQYPKPQTKMMLSVDNGYNALFDASQYTRDDLSYLTYGSGFMGTNPYGVSTFGIMAMNNDAPFVSNAYEGADPQAVTFSDGSRLAVWIGYNNNYSGTEALNLYYSYYNGSWSTPQVVEDDGTADMYPSLSVIDDTAYLVWQDANGSISDAETLDETAGRMGISGAVFDRESVSFSTGAISGGGALDMDPIVCGGGGQVYALWIRNGANDWFGQNYSNSIMYSSCSGGTWSAPAALYSGLGPVTSLAAECNGGLSVAYSVDGDCNLSTQEDGELYLNGVAQTSNDWLDSGAYFSGGNLYWYSGGMLMENGAAALAEGSSLASDRFQIINENGVKAMIYVQNDGLYSRLCAAYYDYSNGCWGSPITLYDGGTSINGFSASATANGEISVLILSQAVVGDGQSGDPYGESSIIWYNAPLGSNLRVDDVRYDNSNYVQGKYMPIYVTVSNTGEMTVSETKLQLVAEDGTVLETLTADEPIFSGQSAEVELQYRVNEIVQARKLTVKVTAVGVTETNTQDNSAELELGWNDLKVENVRWGVTTEGQIIIHASIVNQGYEAQSGINVELRKDNPEGEIVAQQTVAELSPFTLQSIYFTLEEALGGVYYVCIEHKEADQNYGNDSDFVRVLEDLPTEGSCGDDSVWSMDPETGVLTISGSGAMYDYSLEDEAPWSDYGLQIKTVVIDDGITHIGSHAFEGSAGLEKVTISSSVESIGDYAFADCTALAQVEFEHDSNDSLSIAEQAFTSTDALELELSVTDPENINAGVIGYDWAGNQLTVSYSELSCRHEPVMDPEIPATCTTTGKTAGSHCAICNEVLVEQKNTPSLGHAVVVDEEIPATCTEAGKTEGSHCSRCGEVIIPQEVIPATGHNFSEWEQTKAPSLTEDGEESRYCMNSGCDITETRPVKAEIYTIEYDANGGSGAPASQRKLKGMDISLSSAEPVRDGYAFKGWSTERADVLAEYLPGTSYSEDNDITLYAVWESADGHIPGDVNGDGTVNIMDVITLMALLAGDNVSFVPGSTDIDNSGTVNILDIITLMNFISGEDITIY